MDKYGLHDLDNVGTILRYKQFKTQPDPILAPEKPWEWLLVTEVKPSFNSHLEKQTGPVVVVNTGVNITHTWTTTAKSATQLNNERNAKTAEAMDGKLHRAIKSMGLVIADNTPLSPAQVRTQFRAHYKQLLIDEGE